jgi:undecaprenyl-diphosphatase
VTWNRTRKTVAALAAFARSEAASLAILALLAGAVFVFIEIAEEMTEGDSRALDMVVLQALHPASDPRDPIGPAWLDRAAADFTSLGSVSVLVTITLAVMGFLILRRRALEAALLAIALGGGLIISEGLKGLFNRERPPDIYRAAEALNPSFPSGHALLSAVLYLSLGAMLARSTTNKAIRAYVMAGAILITLLVGVTRVYLGVHWATDVLAGWCVGAAWATACWLFERWARTHFAAQPDRDQSTDAARRTSTTS